VGKEVGVLVGGKDWVGVGSRVAVGVRGVGVKVIVGVGDEVSGEDVSDCKRVMVIWGEGVTGVEDGTGVAGTAAKAQTPKQ
jgi:hypothetical protein